MEISKGSIYWVHVYTAGGSHGHRIRMPGLVIQNDVLNASKLSTVSLLAITSTLEFGEVPGNIVLEKGEANMPQRCVVNVSSIKTIDKTSIGERIGTLSEKRMDQVHDGLKLVMSLP